MGTGAGVDMGSTEQFTVGELARRSGVSVRTLHHYDEIGLVLPSARNSAGYRVYGQRDLERLQRVLAYRELGFPLEQIGPLLDDPDLDTVTHLRRQHEIAAGQATRLREVLAALERTMEAHRMGIRLTPEELFEVFGDDDPTQHAAEAEQRWGDTDAYQQSRERTSRYGKADWERIRSDGERDLAAYAAAYAAGLPADSEQAMDAAEAHRRSIDRAFYDCSREMHVGLGEMYVSDPRFAATYDRVAPGLAAYVRDAIAANARRG